MAFENKKFLDKIGITHLWEKIENRFINSEELNVIIEAIDEVKADKTDIVQADWNQNDETALDYVKNKTHWAKESVVELLPETSVTVDSDYAKLPNSITLEVGKTYNVTFNGTVYECVAWSNNNAVLIGNGSIYGGNDISTGNVGGNGEPFSFDSYDNGSIYLNVSESGTYTIKISFQGEVIHKIDEKYLPEIQNKNILDGSAEGSVRTIDSAPEDDEYRMGTYAFAEGFYTKASGWSSHAEGSFTTASGRASHAEGVNTTASGYYSHAEGTNTIASGEASHAEGVETTASGQYSHAEGAETTASGDYQHVQGKYNIVDTENKYAHIVGNGKYNALSNAHTLDWDGNAWFAGDVYIGGTGQDNSDKLATEKKVETSITSPKDYFALTDIDNGYTYIVQMKNGNLVSRCGVSSIKVTTMPNKIEYYAGEYFDDPTGMVVTATCEDGSVIEITNYTCSDNQFIIGENIVTISYNEAGNTYTTTITVNAIEFDAATILIDFEYTDNGDGTYTITAWKGTKNGVASTEMVVPNSSNIIL